MRNIVVLPDPDGPTMVKNSPSSISREIESRALNVPKWRLSPIRLSAVCLCAGSAVLVIRGSAAITNGSRVDVVEPIVVGDDVKLDCVGDALVEFIPLDGVQFVGTEARKHFVLGHLADRLKIAVATGDDFGCVRGGYPFEEIEGGFLAVRIGNG